MKILLFDPTFGISGDMIIAALLDCGLDPEVLERGYRRLKIGRVQLKHWRVKRCGIRASRIRFAGGKRVRFDEFYRLIDSADANPSVKRNAKLILRLIRKIETRLHGRHHPLHELDDLDTLLDVFGFTLAVDHLGVEKVYTGPIGIGTGKITTSHGSMPAFTFFASSILNGFKLIYHDFSGELITPTGAAILATMAQPVPDDFTFRLDRVGLGGGERNDPDHPNILRIMLGSIDPDYHDLVSVLTTNIDDAQPNIYEILIEQVKEKGGYDIYLTPYYGRKSRIGVEVTVIAPIDKERDIARLLLENTPTLGIRVVRTRRHLLPRRVKKVKTSMGEVRIKVAHINRRKRFTIEYDDLKLLARKYRLPIIEVERRLINEINRYEDGTV
ncbi:hypothetical protein DRP53_01990 [candidate division WOR-3 bacterium]|uniref:Nickel insertion protein n=1 Tax=candidate division WOR-3 bacterium TaxID=2052148 RepID=A0A660SKJ2_UNCW3|nr:MAG: hypothetical protein DRP53_01990 [candidate division WOR-3 bacterium]